MIKIGVPRALSYYAFYPLWKTFFEELGCLVICSGITTKGIMDAGVKEAVNDACVPIKVFHGHVLDLKGKVDLVFVPRLVNVTGEKTETFCPKFLGLPDMVQAAFPDLPLFAPRIDLRRGLAPLWKTCYDLGRQLGKDKRTVFRAYSRARLTQKRYHDLLAKGLTPPEALACLEGGGGKGRTGSSPASPWNLSHEKDGVLLMALLGFPYAIYDSFISVDIIRKLRQMGVRILTMEMIPPKSLQNQRKKLPKDLFWYFSNKVVRGALYYLEEKRVDGIIHVTAFGCGPDAMADKLIELEAKNRGRVPFMSITIDEHTGEAGLLTRLEAFTDMIRLGRKPG